MSSVFSYPKVIKSDLFSWASKIFCVAVVLFVVMFFMRSMFYLLAFVSLFGLANILCVIQLSLGQSKIKNEFDRPVFVKMIGSDDVLVLESGCSMYNVEGIKVCNTVFAIAEGFHAVVSEKAEFRVRSGVGKFIVNVSGACKIVPPDESWMKLFDAK